MIYKTKNRRRKKNNCWENLQGFRYAHRGLFHQPRSASRKNSHEKDPLTGMPRWHEDAERLRAEGKRIVPENCMEAFRMAVRHGYGSELDVHLTADGTLAVLHDSDLYRMTGKQGKIEDLTREEIRALRLLGGEDRIPELAEVLTLYTAEEAKTERHDRCIYLPLIIELKSVGKVSALCTAVMEVIDRFPNLNYCIESFDPRVVLWFRRNRPEVIRGQLTENFMKSPEAMRKWGPLMTCGMWCNAPALLTKPDFVAAKYRDRRNIFLRMGRMLFGTKHVNWVIRNQKEMETAEREGSIGIFEGFLP